MTKAALTVLSQNDKGFWLMVESGDVDWANHDNNLDTSIGSVLSGDAGVRGLTEWVGQNGGWDEAALIVAGDHGHYLVLDQPELLIDGKQAASAETAGTGSSNTEEASTESDAPRDAD